MESHDCIKTSLESDSYLGIESLFRQVTPANSCRVRSLEIIRKASTKPATVNEIDWLGLFKPEALSKPDPLVNQKLTGYDWVKDKKTVLGRGGFGVVYLAKHELTGLEVAIKTLIKSKIRSAAITQELNALNRLSHPNICRLFQFHRNKAEVFLVFEYHPTDLRKHRKTQPTGCLPEREAKIYLGDLVSALAYMHQLGFAHRDVKPGNILISVEGRAILTDFGMSIDCSKNRNKLYRTKMCGTPAYISPQVFDRDYSATQADVWSAGVVLFETLFGRLPFVGRSPVEIRANIDRGCDIPKSPSTSPNVLLLLEKMLETNEFKRITALEALKHSWFAQDYHALEAGDNKDHAQRALAECCKLFPYHTKQELKTRIGENNYQAATYKLLLSHPEMLPELSIEDSGFKEEPDEEEEVVPIRFCCTVL